MKRRGASGSQLKVGWLRTDPLAESGLANQTWGIRMELKHFRMWASIGALAATTGLGAVGCGGADRSAASKRQGSVASTASNSSASGSSHKWVLATNGEVQAFLLYLGDQDSDSIAAGEQPTAMKNFKMSMLTCIARVAQKEPDESLYKWSSGLAAWSAQESASTVASTGAVAAHPLLPRRPMWPMP
jgi:hypothetical protein